MSAEIQAAATTCAMKARDVRAKQEGDERELRELQTAKRSNVLWRLCAGQEHLGDDTSGQRRSALARFRLARFLRAAERKPERPARFLPAPDWVAPRRWLATPARRQAVLATRSGVNTVNLYSITTLPEPAMSHILQPPAVLRTPTWYGGPPDESPLLFPAEEYHVEHSGNRAKVRIIASGALIYDGIGPVEIASSDVPF